MRVVEIFDSIDGEGIYTGCLATFIRLTGCNMRCRYCDTTYSFYNGMDLPIEEIVKKVDFIGNEHITLTGGEPLIHKDVSKLIESLSKYTINIETNGSVDVEKYQTDNTIITMDYKTKSSGENNKMSIERINSLRSCDVLKIVCNESDFEDISSMLNKCNVKAHIFLSPIFNEIEPVKLVDFAKQLRDKGHMNDIRVQIQLHKIIWRPEERGV